MFIVKLLWWKFWIHPRARGFNTNMSYFWTFIFKILFVWLYILFDRFRVVWFKIDFLEFEIFPLYLCFNIILVLNFLKNLKINNFFWITELL